METENRKYARCRVPGDMFYLFSKESGINGWVRDISKGGISFEYISFEEIALESKIELIMASDKIPFYLPDIKCKIIHITPKNNSDHAVRDYQIRRCGVQYERLDARMNEKLTILLCKDFMLPA